MRLLLLSALYESLMDEISEIPAARSDDVICGLQFTSLYLDAHGKKMIFNSDHDERWSWTVGFWRFFTFIIIIIIALILEATWSCFWWRSGPDHLPESQSFGGKTREEREGKGERKEITSPRPDGVPGAWGESLMSQEEPEGISNQCV